MRDLEKVAEAAAAFSYSALDAFLEISVTEHDHLLCLPSDSKAALGRAVQRILEPKARAQPARAERSHSFQEVDIFMAKTNDNALKAAERF